MMDLHLDVVLPMLGFASAVGGLVLVKAHRHNDSARRLETPTWGGWLLLTVALVSAAGSVYQARLSREAKAATQKELDETKVRLAATQTQIEKGERRSELNAWIGLAGGASDLLPKHADAAWAVFYKELGLKSDPEPCAGEPKDCPAIDTLIAADIKNMKEGFLKIKSAAQKASAELRPAMTAGDAK